MRCFALLACVLCIHAQSPPRRELPESAAPIAGMTPFTADCAGNQTGTVYRNSAVEPFIAADPGNPAHLVGVWQQDRWSNGGANGVLAAVSLNRGRTWTTSSPHFSLCTGGVWERASDPWVTISPDGTVHYAALGVNGAGALTSVLVSRSSDGGLTWTEPITVSAKAGEDKESIVADPTDSHFVYTIWDNTAGDRIPVWFSRTTDGGLTWEAPRVIYDPGKGGYATAHQMVVLPDGTLLDIFTLSFPAGNQRTPVFVAVMRSSDHGATWSTPRVVDTDQTVGAIDVKTKVGLRTGGGIPSSSVDPLSGAVYIVWSDSRFSGGLRDGVALVKSLDGGVTWTAPVQVNQVPQVQAFTPTVAAGTGGRVEVTYYDFRQDTSDKSTLLTNYWRARSQDGGGSWSETPLAGPFDILSAPLAGAAPFIGDYQGMAASGESFVAFFVAANDGNADNPSSLFASASERPGNTRWTSGRTEINFLPQSLAGGRKGVPELPLSNKMKH